MIVNKERILDCVLVFGGSVWLLEASHSWGYAVSATLFALAVLPNRNR